MKRYAHQVGFTPQSGIAFMELDPDQLERIHAVKLDGARLDMQAHWDVDWTHSALASGRWIEMKDDETPGQARQRIKQTRLLLESRLS